MSIWQKELSDVFFGVPILFDSISEIDVIQVDGWKEEANTKSIVFHCEIIRKL